VVTVSEVLKTVLPSALTGILAYLAAQRKVRADAGLSDANSAKVMVDIAKDIAIQLREDNRKTQEELQAVYNELETAKQTIVDLQTRVEQRTRENTKCIEHVNTLERRIEELTAPDKRGRQDPTEGNR
jgi:hypothetical protein